MRRNKKYTYVTWCGGFTFDFCKTMMCTSHKIIEDEFVTFLVPTLHVDWQWLFGMISNIVGLYNMLRGIKNTSFD